MPPLARGILSSTLALASVLFWFVTAMLAFDVHDRVEKDRRYLACFESAAGLVTTEAAAGRPAPREIDSEACLPIHVNQWDGELAKPPFDGKTRPPPGGFTLSFWRGEWTEYYASWSGQTTLLTSTAAYYRAFWPGILEMLALALATLWGGWRIARPLFKHRANA